MHTRYYSLLIEVFGLLPGTHIRVAGTDCLVVLRFFFILSPSLFFSLLCYP